MFCESPVFLLGPGTGCVLLVKMTGSRASRKTQVCLRASALLTLAKSPQQSHKAGPGSRCQDHQDEIKHVRFLLWKTVVKENGGKSLETLG